MNTDFAKLKQNRLSNAEKLNEKLKQINQGGGYQKDPTFWELTVDKASNGSAIIRFLPAPKGEEVPYVRYWNHSFKGPGGWYIENCRTSLGQNEKDPVAELNTELWNSTKDEDAPARKQARAQSRNLIFVSNIYVVKDPSVPENDGKVFKFKYGKKIFDKIYSKMNPPEELGDAVQPMNPFDLWEGATFRLVARKKDGFRNYDESEFLAPAPLFTDDEKLEKVWISEYSLQEIVDPKNFKSYDDLKKRLEQVLKQTVNTRATDEDEEAPAPTAKAASAPTASTLEEAAAPAKETPAAPAASAPDEDDEDGLAFFKQLAEE